MDSSSLLQALEQIGLNHHESQVYLTLLTNGQMSASQLGKKSHAPRTTIRSILDKLCMEGIVDKIYRGSTQYYSCLPASALVRSVEREILLKKRQAEMISALAPSIEALRNSGSHLPVVRYFEGERGIMEAFNHSLISGAKEILFFTSYDFFQTGPVREYDVGDYMPNRIRRGIRMRVLMERTKEAEHWAGRPKSELREHRFLQKGAKLPGSFFIYGKYVLYFSANKGEYIAVLSESSVMAATMKTLFECLWTGAER